MTSGALILKDDCLSQIMSGFGDDPAASVTSRHGFGDDQVASVTSRRST